MIPVAVVGLLVDVGWLELKTKFEMNKENKTKVSPGRFPRRTPFVCESKGHALPERAPFRLPYCALQCNKSMDGVRRGFVFILICRSFRFPSELQAYTLAKSRDV
jgi:hypothetical protein